MVRSNGRLKADVRRSRQWPTAALHYVSFAQRQFVGIEWTSATI